MNIYVIYKFADSDIVKAKVDEILAAISDKDESGKEKFGEKNSIFMFEPNKTPKNWHSYAKQKLKDSQLVVIFDSLSGDYNSVGKHISWEIKQAEKLNKRIVVFKSDIESKNRSWYEEGYSKQDPKHSRYKTVKIDDAVDFMVEECKWSMNDNLLHKTKNNEILTDEDKILLLEQYKIMIDTSEKLMERRQETVNLYTTLCTALIALIGASFAFSDLRISATILLLSGLILIVLCRNWYLSLASYDKNNYGKFEVINLLEKQLPAEIFQCEYRHNKRNGIGSFSAREKVLPQIFSVLGAILMAIACIMYIVIAIK